jgi:hypothetical protein
MYEFFRTQTGWVLFWRPPPAELTVRHRVLETVPSTPLSPERPRNAAERLLAGKA